jgi:hypothetical protein
MTTRVVHPRSYPQHGTGDTVKSFHKGIDLDVPCPNPNCFKRRQKPRKKP